MKLGMQELIIVLIIVVIVLGPTQIPKLRKMFKKGKKDLQDAVKGGEEDEEE